MTQLGRHGRRAEQILGFDVGISNGGPRMLDMETRERRSLPQRLFKGWWNRSTEEGMLNTGSWLLEDAYIMVNNTDSIDFPIRQLQVRVPLPPEEEPPKDRMDPGLQEVRSFTLD